MQLQEMTLVQLSQLNIPNIGTMRDITEAAWRSRDGQYIVLKVCFHAFTEDGGRHRNEQIRFLRVYITDDRGIHMPIYVELMCSGGAEAFVLTEIDCILADRPKRVELFNRLADLWRCASRPTADGDRSHITIPGYAQYKTKGEQ